MNKVIEKEIMRAPEQYMWLHRRFKPDRPARPRCTDPLSSPANAGLFVRHV
ncbi:hypothetical protein M5585_05815 [Serratia ureilytica]